MATKTRKKKTAGATGDQMTDAVLAPPRPPDDEDDWDPDDDDNDVGG
jgi:hypothetical protein